MQENDPATRDLAFAIEALWEVTAQYEQIVQLGLVDVDKASALVREHERQELERQQKLAR